MPTASRASSATSSGENSSGRNSQPSLSKSSICCWVSFMGFLLFSAVRLHATWPTTRTILQGLCRSDAPPSGHHSRFAGSAIAQPHPECRVEPGAVALPFVPPLAALQPASRARRHPFNQNLYKGGFGSKAGGYFECTAYRDFILPYFQRGIPCPSRDRCGCVAVFSAFAFSDVWWPWQPPVHIAHRRTI